MARLYIFHLCLATKYQLSLHYITFNCVLLHQSSSGSQEKPAIFRTETPWPSAFADKEKLKVLRRPDVIRILQEFVRIKQIKVEFFKSSERKNSRLCFMFVNFGCWAEGVENYENIKPRLFIYSLVIPRRQDKENCIKVMASSIKSKIRFGFD